MSPEPAAFMICVDADRQAVFAALSGDRNPLHLDAAEARRTQFGSPVVHGIHLVLLALEALEEPAPFSIAALDVQFRSAVRVDETVSVEVVRPAPRMARMTIRGEGQVRIVITCELADPVPGEGVVARSGGPAGSIAPAELTLDELRSAAGREPVWVDVALLGSKFPRLAAVASQQDLAVLLATTRIVGMRAPGRWTLFRRLTWTAARVARAQPDELVWSTGTVDPRISLATVDIHDGRRRLRAEVIVRRPPPAQPSVMALRAVVSPTEFAGMHALVVGGSRGLGELAAKLIVAGGGRVVVTYRSGAADAAAVAAQLGEGSHALELDVEHPATSTLAAIVDERPSHLLWFATPLIARRSSGTWDAATFGRFVAVYVTSLSEMLAVLDPLGCLQGLLVPSSAYVAERPAGFAEYAAAKAAAEALSAAWAALRPEQRMVVPRFPPLVTDQTAAQLGSSTAGNVAPMLAALRDLRRVG